MLNHQPTEVNPGDIEWPSNRQAAFLGNGRFGAVYKCKYNGQDVAVKQVLNKHQSIYEEVMEKVYEVISRLVIRRMRTLKS